MREVNLNNHIRRLSPTFGKIQPKKTSADPTVPKTPSQPQESVQIAFQTPLAEAPKTTSVATPPVEKKSVTPVVDTGPKFLDFSPTSVGAASGQAMVNPNGTLSIFDTKPQPERDEKFLKKYGPWGVVTGASQGIGAEYARALAEKGMNVVMVARSGDKMTKLAKELSEDHGVNVRVVSADLGSKQGIDQVQKATSNLEVGLLVNNAGAWQMGSFLDQDPRKLSGSMGLNLAAPLQLTHHFSKQMSERGKGGVLNVGSAAAFHGVPGQAAYSGGKGYLRNFTESLHRELKPSGVDVMITNPGPVVGETSSSQYDQSKLPLQKVTGRQVAVQSLDRLGKGGSSTIPGWLNRQALSVATRLMPRNIMSSIAGMIVERATLPQDGGTVSTSSPKPQAQTASQTTATASTNSGPPKSDQEFKEKYGPWGVVTGASQGLGATYAESLAKKGMNVVVVARNEKKLGKLAEQLESKYGVKVKTVAADLSSSDGLEKVGKQTENLDVGLLVNNAGAWQMGKFLENDVGKDVAGLDLNVKAPVELSHLFGNRMKARGGGGIVNVGSGSGAYGVPGQATYSAGKGFLQNFTESIAGEMGKHKIDVLITNPAAIEGEASSIYDQDKVPLQTLKADAVVEDSLQGLGRRTTTVPGLYNKLAVGAAGLAFSRDQLSFIGEKILERAAKPSAQ